MKGQAGVVQGGYDPNSRITGVALDSSDPAYKGQKDYGPLMLAVYDWWVLGFMARTVWKSPTPLILER